MHQRGQFVHAGAGVRVVGPQLAQQLHGGQGEEEGVAIAGVRPGRSERILHGGNRSVASSEKTRSNGVGRSMSGR